MKSIALASLLLAGCASGVIVAQGITTVAEGAAGAALQHKAISVPDLTSLATDLGNFPGTPLSTHDNVVLANLVTELLAKKQANLTDASVVDGVNRAVAALTATSSPTAAEGIAWADLQDVVTGLKAEVKLVNENPSLLPQ